MPRHGREHTVGHELFCVSQSGGENDRAFQDRRAGLRLEVRRFFGLACSLVSCLLPGVYWPASHSAAFQVSATRTELVGR